MKKITFKVSLPKDGSVISLIKDVNKISCRIFLDLKNGSVAVENVNDSMIDDVIELIDKYYTILSIDIDNTIAQEVAKNPATEETCDTGNEKQHAVLGPQSEDDLIIKKVEFENEYVENRINNFLKTAYWALYNQSATEKDIGDFILTCMSEISMRYSPKPVIKFAVGDIVDVNYGSHLPGEIVGGHVHAIVCNILNEDMAYVVPITKARTDITSQSYLPMDTPNDVTYYNEFYKGGTVIVDKGKYVRAERFHSVIGKTTPEFFEKLLYQLASAFDFTACLLKKVEKDDDLPFTMEDTFAESDESADEEFVAEDDTKVEEAAIETAKFSATAKKIGGEESALLEIIGFAFDKLDSSQKVEKQVETFLTDIGMTTTERMVTQSFVVACDIKKINYENVILGLHEKFPKVKEEIIKSILKEAFKNWLDKYPILAERCPKISLMAVLKAFAKRAT